MFLKNSLRTRIVHLVRLHLQILFILNHSSSGFQSDTAAQEGEILKKINNYIAFICKIDMQAS